MDNNHCQAKQRNRGARPGAGVEASSIRALLGFRYEAARAGYLLQLRLRRQVAQWSASLPLPRIPQRFPPPRGSSWAALTADCGRGWGCHGLGCPRPSQGQAPWQPPPPSRPPARLTAPRPEKVAAAAAGGRHQLWRQEFLGRRRGCRPRPLQRGGVTGAGRGGCSVTPCAADVAPGVAPAGDTLLLEGPREGVLSTCTEAAEGGPATGGLDWMRIPSPSRAARRAPTPTTAVAEAEVAETAGARSSSHRSL